MVLMLVADASVVGDEDDDDDDDDDDIRMSHW